MNAAHPELILSLPKDEGRPHHERPRAGRWPRPDLLAVLAVGLLGVSAGLWLVPGLAPALAGVALASLVIAWAALATPAARTAPWSWRIALGGLLATSFLALYPSVDLDISLPRLQGILLGVAAFGVLLSWLNSEQRLSRATAGLVVLVLLVSALGLVADWPNGGKGLALNAVYSQLPHWPGAVPYLEDRGLNPNKLAAPLAMLVPSAAAAGLFSRRRWQRIAWRFAALALFGAVLLTQSRSAYLAVAAGVLLVLTVASRRFLLLLVPVLALAAWLVAWSVGPRELVGDWPTPPMLGGGAGSLADGREAADYSLSSRVQVWTLARAMVDDFPLTGIGLGTFPDVAQSLYGPAYSDVAPLFPDDAEVPHAHNLALQVALDLGVPGLGFFVLLTACLGAAARRAIAWAPSPQTRGLAAGAAAGLLTYYVFGITDVIGPGEKPSILYWLLAATVVACARLPRIEPD